MAMEEKAQLAQKSPQGGYSILHPHVTRTTQCNACSQKFSEIFKLHSPPYLIKQRANYVLSTVNFTPDSAEKEKGII